ncbi:hypothetical protein ACOSQ3_020134 [Xanthoceras sorbifolium]
MKFLMTTLKFGNTVAVAVILWNRGDSKATIAAQWSDIGLKSSAAVDARDLWEHTTTHTVKHKIEASLESHACKMYILTPQ